MNIYIARISCFSILFLLVAAMGTAPTLAASENSLSGIVYSPVKRFAFFENVVKDDISTISSFTENIRLYTTDDNTEKVLKNAQTNNLRVAIGIDLNQSDDAIQSDMQTAVNFAHDYPDTISSVVIGSDAIAQKQVTADELGEYLELFISNNITVSSANSAHVWKANPALADKVDYILLYSFDFWEGMSGVEASENAILQHDKLQEIHPDKLIVIETGWPSDGTPIDGAMPSEQEQLWYLKNFVALADQRNIPYYIFEYANESWKPEKNGNDAEGNWGVLLEERKIKPHLVGMVKFETIKYGVVIEENGQTHYTPAIARYEGDKVMKVSIPDEISGISYDISGQEKQVSTDGKKTVLFVQDSQNQDITITTDKYSGNLEFSLIPQAFAACDVDAVCYNVSAEFFTVKNIVMETPLGEIPLVVPSDNVILLIMLTSILFGIVLYIFSMYNHRRRKEWDSVSIKIVS